MDYRKEVDKATEDVDFETAKYSVELDTSEGLIRLDLAPEVAPGHCLNMIGLARCGFYDNLVFHRIIKGFMIQGGCPSGTGTGGPGFNIDAEFNARPHVAGVLSMARSSSPNSAGSQFFVCLDAHKHLDRNYTAFGNTADAASLEVVKKIGMVETDSSDRPRKPVTIRKATVKVTPV
jgi:peptidyl-prolyl cis-trans isomerase B (cyclophilin B)